LFGFGRNLFLRGVREDEGEAKFADGASYTSAVEEKVGFGGDGF
jgi:hypothetical protein